MDEKEKVAPASALLRRWVAMGECEIDAWSATDGKAGWAKGEDARRGAALLLLGLILEAKAARLDDFYRCDLPVNYVVKR